MFDIDLYVDISCQENGKRAQGQGTRPVKLFVPQEIGYRTNRIARLGCDCHVSYLGLHLTRLKSIIKSQMSDAVALWPLLPEIPNCVLKGIIPISS